MKILGTAVLFSWVMCVGHAAAKVDQHELQMLEKAKSIEFCSQKIAKAYFYKQLDIRGDRAGEDMKDSLAQLKKDLLHLQDGITGKEEENIMTFLNYTYDELETTLATSYSKEHAALLIDYSESLLEGAEFLSSRHRSKKADSEEHMLVEAENLRFLLERINKLYIAHKAGFRDYNNVVQLEKAVEDFEVGLAKINSYGKYPDHAQESVGKTNKLWPVAKTFYLGEKGALPKIVLASTEKLEKEIGALKDYHHKAAGRK